MNTPLTVKDEAVDNLSCHRTPKQPSSELIAPINFEHQSHKLMGTADEPAGPTVLLSETYDPARDGSLSGLIVRVVAIVSDQEGTDLEPLGRVIDAEALDRLVRSGSVGNPATPVEVSFSYEGFTIDIDAEGTVNVLVEDQ